MKDKRSFFVIPTRDKRNHDITTRKQIIHKIESLSKRRFWAADGNGTEHFAHQDSGFWKIFKLIVSTSEKKCGNEKAS